MGARKLLLPDQYKEILSHLISIKIVQEKMLFTIYGSPKELIKLKLQHHIHLPFDKSIIIERTIQYVKDRTESFDDYFPCKSEKRRCKLEHILNWFKMFIDDMHDRSIIYTHAK